MSLWKQTYPISINKSKYIDKDAGLYVHGNYIKGVGHLSYKVDDLEYGLPILIQRYKGSSNVSDLSIYQ